MAIVSHEFRTPLTGIIGFAQTLQRQLAAGTLSPEITAISLERIQINANRLSRLVGNMLAVTSTVEAFNEEDHSLHTMIVRVVEETVDAPAEQAPHVIIDVPSELAVRVNAEHLVLILSNLVDNGRKFAETGSDLRIAATGVEGNVRISFTNAALPIPAHLRSQIFAPFVQADSSDSRQYEGLGMGLHVVQKLCAAYGGELGMNCADGLVEVCLSLPAGHLGDRAHEQAGVTVIELDEERVRVA